MSSPIPQQLLQQPPPMLRNPHLESQRASVEPLQPETPAPRQPSNEPPKQATDFVLLTGNLAANVLYCTAFPLLTALYAARGLTDEPVEPTSFEKKIIKFFNTDAEKLNECYSPLVALGFPFFAASANGMGILSILWANWVGIIQPPNDQEMLSMLQSCERVTKGLSIVAGILGFIALGTWTSRRQQRRSKKGGKKMWAIGCPEVSLAFLSLVYYPLVSTPIYL